MIAQDRRPPTAPCGCYTAPQMSPRQTKRPRMRRPCESPAKRRDGADHGFAVDILEGTFDFSLAGRAFTAGAGAFVYLPKGRGSYPSRRTIDTGMLGGCSINMLPSVHDQRGDPSSGGRVR